MNIKEISVIGAGTMGNGIAHVFAQSGYSVTLIDREQGPLDKALARIAKNMDRQINKGKLSEGDKENALQRITSSTDIAQGVATADVIIEVVSENMAVKEAVLSAVDTAAKEDAIIASNTSSISITKLASFTNRPERFIGMHFMNPVPVMKLIEVIRGYATSQETMDTILALSKAIGKVPVEANDYPGFVANRILIPMINEAIYTLHEGVAGVEEIDTVMMLGMAHPMGPLHLADFIGLDVVLSIANVLYDGFGQGKYAPCPLLVNMVNAGKLGAKTGEGFYVYTPGSKDKTVSPQFK